MAPTNWREEWSAERTPGERRNARNCQPAKVANSAVRTCSRIGHCKTQPGFAVPSRRTDPAKVMAGRSSSGGTEYQQASEGRSACSLFVRFAVSGGRRRPADQAAEHNHGHQVWRHTQELVGQRHVQYLQLDLQRIGKPKQ